jgi:hypothetical protein
MVIFFHEHKWSISGFDNFSYYTITDNIIMLSLNIANLNDNTLDVFDFKGIINNNKKKYIIDC